MKEIIVLINRRIDEYNQRKNHFQVYGYIKLLKDLKEEIEKLTHKKGLNDHN